jgi:hypothetical protein
MALMDIQADIIKACFCAAFSFLLYRTDFLMEYGSLLRLFSDSARIDYMCFKLRSPKTNYLEYLNFKYNNFVTRLISCPYCLGFWTSCFVCYFSYDLFFVYYVYILLYSVLLLIIDANGIRN